MWHIHEKAQTVREMKMPEAIFSFFFFLWQCINVIHGKIIKKGGGGRG